jgi:hypothetical protein
MTERPEAAVPALDKVDGIRYGNKKKERKKQLELFLNNNA